MIELIGVDGGVFDQYVIQDTAGTCPSCLVLFGDASPTPIAGIRVATGATDYVLFEDLMYGEPLTGQSFCACDGSSPAPCGNQGAAATGCRNGAYSAGCHLSAFGAPSVTGGAVVLRSTQAAPGAVGLFFQGDSTIQGGSGIPFGDGLRCVGDQIVRL